MDTIGERSQFNNDDMQPEYDFSSGVRGKHYRSYQQGHTVTIHEEDGSYTIQHFTPEDGSVMLDAAVQPYFPTAEAVNEALRLVLKMTAIPVQPGD